MYDIITFGSATRDNFLILKQGDYKIIPENNKEESWLCFPFSSKIFIDEVKIFSGGGGTNAACSFSFQGFKSAYVGKVGNDKRGEAIIEELKQYGIDTSLIKKDGNHPTAYSLIFSLLGRDRTILISKGACHFLKKEEIPWEKIKKAKWFYLAPLSYDSAMIFGEIVKFAKKNSIKVAANPGASQLELKKEVLREILPNIDIFILNKEEASLIAGVSFKGNEAGIAKKIFSDFGLSSKNILVITKGKDGSMAFDGKHIFKAGIPSVLPLEKTGAGDAFGSGFLAGFLKKDSIEYALQLATANATSCIQKIGAKNGLLKKGEWGSWPKVAVKKIALQ